MTREECRLWYDFLKDYPVRFLRQKVIDNYIADFYCNKARLVIEPDGSQHYEEKGLLLGQKELKVAILKLFEFLIGILIRILMTSVN